MVVNVIVAVSENGVIGREGDLPWRLPADLRRFKALTMGHPMILGRRTYDSIGRPLPGRLSIVLTRDPEPLEARLAGVENVAVVADLESALARAAAAGTGEVFVIGGAEIYRQALPRADRLYRTLIHAEIEGETSFSPVDPSRWRRVEAEFHPADDRHAFPFTFEMYERRKADGREP